MIDLQDQWDEKPRRWPRYLGIAVAGLLAVNALLWIVQGIGQKKDDSATQALDQALTTQKKELDAFRERLFEEKKQLDAGKDYIDGGMAQDRKKAAQQYQLLADRYQTDTDRFRAMASEYNKKVSEFQANKSSQKRWLLVPFPIRVSAD
jgi:hypothetical protein